MADGQKEIDVEDETMRRVFSSLAVSFTAIFVDIDHLETLARVFE
jgi:hypothetical protein